MNLAAESHVDRRSMARRVHQTNVLGTFTLLQQALRYWRGLDCAAQSSFRLHHISLMRFMVRLARGSFRRDPA